MTSCSHQGDQGCVPQAASATPIASASSSRARRRSSEHARGLGKRLAAARLDLDLRRDQLARRVLAERRRVGARLQLGETVDEAVRLGVDDLELLLDREGEILRTVEDSARLVEGRERVRDAQAHRREVTSALERRAFSRRPDLPIPPAWSDRGGRTSFSWAWPACFGWSTGLWAVPLVAFALLEIAWTVAEHVRGRSDGRGRYVR